MSNGYLFNKSTKLLRGSVFEEIIRYKTFLHIKSTFKDAWYNFIVPQYPASELDWSEAREVIEREQKNGFSLSYYIEDSLLAEYQKYFRARKHKQLGTEYYMTLSKRTVYDDVPGELVEVDYNNLEEFVKITKSHFPDWESNEHYSRTFYELQSIKSSSIFKNYLYQVDNQVVGTCGIIISPKLNLAYLHNMGILKAYRRQGHFSNNTKLLINLSISHGVTETYSLVDEADGSYYGFMKIGYVSRDKYYLFDSQTSV